MARQAVLQAADNLLVECGFAKFTMEGIAAQAGVAICGEARIVERAFGLGGSALSELVKLLNERLQLEAA